MKSEILEKLKYVDSAEFKIELEVVYMMVQIGKLLEIMDLSVRFATLNFYRNWCVHSKLDRNNSISRKVLTALDNTEMNQAAACNLLFLLGHNQFFKELENFDKNYLGGAIMEKVSYEQFISNLFKVVANIKVIVRSEDAKHELYFDNHSNLIIKSSDSPYIRNISFKGTIGL